MWTDRRRRLTLLLAGAAVLSTALIGASRISSGETGARAAAGPGSTLAGIPQAGAALGNPNALVTLVEYADLQCPYLWMREASSALIGATGGCETVQSSSYAEVLGVPVALLGLIAYSLLLGTAVLPNEAALFMHTVLALAAVVFSRYLFYVQIELVGAICDWCLASDSIVSVLAILALLRYRLAQGSPSVPG